MHRNNTDANFFIHAPQLSRGASIIAATHNLTPLGVTAVHTSRLVGLAQLRRSVTHQFIIITNCSGCSKGKLREGHVNDNDVHSSDNVCSSACPYLWVRGRWQCC